MKIVSLLPSATEIVYALDLGDDLSGVTFECDYPAEARSKPVVSDTALPTDRPLSPRETDAEVRARMKANEPIYVLDEDLLRQIEPDVVITQDLCKVCAVPTNQVRETLAELDSKAEVLSLDPHGLDDVLDSIVAVGKATGAQDRASTLVEGLRKRIEEVKTAAARLPTIRTLCLEWMEPPMVAGHWVPEMVTLAAGHNLLGEEKGRSKKVTWREVADSAPEVAVHMPCGYYLGEAEEEAARLYSVPELRQTTAFASETVFAADASSYFSRPGPRIVDGLEILAWSIHPDAFPDPPPDSIVAVPAPALR